MRKGLDMLTCVWGGGGWDGGGVDLVLESSKAENISSSVLGFLSAAGGLGDSAYKMKKKLN